MNSTREKFLETFYSIDFNQIKDHPNILIAARFWDHDRYCAAKILYKVMRKIDDLIDDYKAANKLIASSERKEFVSQVNDWLKMIIVSDNCNPLQKELQETIERFRIPVRILEDFARSMIYDINNDGFPTLNDFLEYSRGASVAPASIFVHLNCLTENGGGYITPAIDVIEVAKPCAIFSYLVHIIRDFQKDQFNNLNYFADDLIAKHRLTRHDLKEIAWGHPVNENFRHLIREYYNLADTYRAETRKTINSINPLLEPEYQLSLKIIFDLYMMVFERIDPEKGSFTTEALNPRPEEIKKRVYETILKFTDSKA